LARHDREKVGWGVLWMEKKGCRGGRERGAERKVEGKVRMEDIWGLEAQ